MSSNGAQSVPSIHAGRRSSITMSRANMIGSMSKRNVAFEAKLDNPVQKKNAVVVLNEDGKDVTPRSLLNLDAVGQNATGKTQSKQVINFSDTASVGTPSELFNQSAFGASTYQASYVGGLSKSMMSSVLGSSRASLDSVVEEVNEPRAGNDFGGLQDIQRRYADVKEELTEEDLNKMVTVTLEETDTIWHYDVPGTSVSTLSDIAQHVRERNEQYKKLCDSRYGNDMYAQRGMQTFNHAEKAKEMQTDAIPVRDVCCLASTSDMYDTYHEPDASSQVQEDEDLLEAPPLKAKAVDQEATPVDVTLATSILQRANTVDINDSRASSLSLTSTSFAEVSVAHELSTTGSEASASSESSKIMKMDSLRENLFVMERMVVQSIYHARQAAYRGLHQQSAVVSSAPGGGDEGEKTQDGHSSKLGPNLARLWAYACPATKGKAVTCMVWNKSNKDLLAVGYGNYAQSSSTRGLACVWCIKNPEFPERMFETRCAVTAIDFSTSMPNLLAVGMYDGTVAVFNVRNNGTAPVLDSFDSVGKHSAPVWELKWIEKDKGTGEEKGEVLISGSADGRITQWSIRKGFEYLDLMKLKRTSPAHTRAAGKKNAVAGAKKSDSLISRYDSGLCFDFHKKDCSIYIVGTEEGHLHKCSCSYNEQCLDTFSAHTGPVLRALWSPFDDSAFLSCSADWTVRLWHLEKPQPVVTLQGSTKAVHAIDWSPVSPTMFAAINDDQMEVWDLAVSTLDPLLINLPVAKSILTAVLFALNSEALLVGDSDGFVTVYQLREIPLRRSFQSDWLATLATSSAQPCGSPSDDGSSFSPAHDEKPSDESVER